MVLYLVEKDTQVKPLEKALKQAGIKDYKILALSGHILRMLEPKEYEDGIKDWVKAYQEKKLPYVPKVWKYKLNTDDKRYAKRNREKFKRIKDIIKKVDKIYLATDPDPEGASLGYEVIEQLGMTDKIAGMLNMNDTTVSALVKEVKNPSITNWKELVNAARGRQKGDWILGHNTTVAATVLLGNAIKDKEKIINVGPVKSVVMRMVVDRDLQYENFKELPFWYITGKSVYHDTSFEVKFLYKEEDKWIDKIDKKNIVENYFNAIKNNPIGKVINIKKTNKKSKPPKPLTKTALQSLAGRIFGYNLKKIQDIMQSLYEGKHGGVNEGYISYPRTDIDVYSMEEFKIFPNIISNLKNQFPDILNKIDTNNLLFRKEVYFQPGKNKKEVPPHFALRPTGRNDLEKLSKEERNIYNLIFAYWVYQLYPDYEYESISGELSTVLKEVKATFNSNETKNLGWKEVQQKIEKKNVLEKHKVPLNIKKDEEIKYTELEIKEGKTKPKPRFTQTELALAMEKIVRIFDDPEIKKYLKDTGIGTPATRDIHIMSLIKDGYFEIEKKGKKEYIKSTDKTRKIIELLPDELTNPILRAKMEQFIQDAKSGKIEEKEIVEHFIKETKNFIKKLEEVAKKNNVSINNSNKNEVKTNLKCPLCGNAIIEKSKAFVCEAQKWDPKTKKISGCPFTIWKKSKVFNKEISINDLEKLLSGKEVKDNKGTIIKLDLNSPYYIKTEFKNNFKELDIICPKCKKGKIIEVDNGFKCSNAKWNNKTKKNEGCDFFIFKKIKPLKYTLKEKDIKELIENGKLQIKNAILKLDLTSPYFTSLEFNK